MIDTPTPRARIRQTRQRILAVFGALTFIGISAAGCHAMPSGSGPLLNPIVGGLSGSPDIDGGAVPDEASVFDDNLPGVANLDRALRSAVREAALEAHEDGIEFTINSGWRSPEYQSHLLNEAVEEYGSREEAARWVATVETSAHVTGDAVDLGPYDATNWLRQHGSDYGLCQIYVNESWHYELRPNAIDDVCPAMYTDPTEDPRMLK